MSQSNWEKSTDIKVQIQDDTFTYLDKAISILHNSLRGMYYHRTMKDILTNSEFDRTAVAIYIQNASLQVSVIEWAKLFGSKKDGTHFSKLASEKILYDLNSCFSKINISNSHDLETSLLTTINKTPSDFDKYRTDMLKFRDKFIAHTDLDLYRIPANIEEEQKQNEKRLHMYPSLDIAIESLLWLHSLILNLLECKKSEHGKFTFNMLTRNKILELTEKECNELKLAFKIPSKQPFSL